MNNSQPYIFIGGPCDGEIRHLSKPPVFFYVHTRGSADKPVRIHPDKDGRVVSGTHKYEKMGYQYKWCGNADWEDE